MSSLSATASAAASYDEVADQMSALSLNPLSLPVTCESISRFMEQDREVRSQKGRLNFGCSADDKEIPEKIAKIINEMANFAKEISMKGGNEFIYTRYGNPKDSRPPKIRVSTLPYNTWRQEKSIMTIVSLIWQNAFKVSAVKAHANSRIDFTSTLDPRGWNTLGLSWHDGNVHLLPRPKFEKPILTSAFREKYFSEMVGRQEFADVCFIVEKQSVPAHAIVLAQSEYFKTMLTGPFRESRDKQPIVFENADHKTFIELLRFLYTGKVRPEVLQNVSDWLALLELAVYIKVDHLKNVCIAKIFELISEESFIPIALTQMRIEDQDLARLCDWFLKVYPNFAQRLELENVSSDELLVLHNLATKQQIKGLDTRCADCLQRQVTLDKDFLTLCQQIVRLKDKQLKAILINVVKKDPAPFKSMLQGDPKYASHSEVYTKIMTDPDLM